MSTKYIVNNLPGQTIDGNTIDPKYRVYTALLTQSGGDDPQQVIGDGTQPGGFPPNNIIEGVTYTISSNTDGDFIPFGAPNNDIGTSFVATQNTGYYSAIFELDYNTGAPIVTVLENTIGNIWFTYNTIGRYSANSDSLFTLSKTYSTIESQAIDTVGDGIKTATITYDNPVDDAVVINTGIVSDQQYDSFLTSTPFEIRVYN